MSYNNPLVNFGGGTINNYFSSFNALTKQQADNIYVNEKGDSMKGNLDMKNNKIINVQNPKDLQDVTTKKYIDYIFRSFHVTLKQFLFDSSNK